MKNVVIEAGPMQGLGAIPTPVLVIASSITEKIFTYMAPSITRRISTEAFNSRAPGQLSLEGVK
jgi:hypothetical protein